MYLLWSLINLVAEILVVFFAICKYFVMGHCVVVFNIVLVLCIVLYVVCVVLSVGLLCVPIVDSCPDLMLLSVLL